MRKLQKAAVAAVALGSFGFVGAGTAHAAGGRGGTDFDIRQGSQCRSHDTNVDVLGEVGVANGLLGNAIGGEGSPGAQSTRMGSSAGCDNTAEIKGGDENKGGGSEGREGSRDKGDDAHKGGGSEGREGKEGRESTQSEASPVRAEGGEQRAMAPAPSLHYTVRTESLSTS
ncbi:hypothetical protein ACO0M4_32545 [Streptomyces sp. RGM 3693]|uniref:hypothetical protein n=1 Tax=Streptomyces sp. RGM 3693 TaxID=3413284 RepID=UPI003D2C367D